MRKIIPLLAMALAAACSGSEGNQAGSPQAPGTTKKADSSADTRKSRSFTFVYEASVKDVPEGAQQVRMWVPVPSTTPEQEVGRITCAVTVGGATETRDLAALGALKKVGDADVTCTVADVRHGKGRTLCVASGSPFGITLKSEITRHEDKGGTKATAAEREMAMKPLSKVPLGGKVSAVAKELPTGGSAMETARILYDHTLERMRYDKPAGGDWGRGDSEWACDSKFGNCTDFHSYFMALAWSKGIPARFTMGFPVPAGDEAEAKVGGYHCWAHFYDEKKGWVPVDISEADKDPSKADYLFGSLDPDRVTMIVGRDIELTPAPAAGALNFLVYPYCEVDGQEHKGIDKSFQRLQG